MSNLNKIRDAFINGEKDLIPCKCTIEQIKIIQAIAVLGISTLEDFKQLLTEQQKTVIDFAMSSD